MKKLFIFIILGFILTVHAADQVRIMDRTGQEKNPGASNRWPVSRLNANAAVKTQLLTAPTNLQSHYVTGFILGGGAVNDGFHILRQDCLDFNGSNNTWTVTDAAQLQFDAGDFSLALWVRNTLSTPTQAGLISKDDGDDGYILEITSGGLVKFTMGDGSTDTPITGATDITDGWHYIAVTCDRDSTTGLNLYVDGVADATAVDPTSSNGQCDGTGTNLTSTGTANGNIYVSNIGIYKGAALTAATLLANYNSGIGLKLEGDETNLSAGWNNDESLSTACYDVLATNDATLSNTVWSPTRQSGATAEVNITGVPFAIEDMMTAVGKFHCGLGSAFGGVFIKFPHPVKIGRACPLSILETNGAFDLIMFGYTDAVR